MRKVKHSKFRNTGLLYEFLLRQITTEILDKDSKENATKIVKDYFNENIHLGRELNLYSLLMQRKFKDDRKAEYFINEVVKARHKLNNSTLKRERYNLIKNIYIYI